MMKSGAAVGIGVAIVVVALIIYAISGIGAKPAEPALEGEINVGLLVATSGDFGAYGRENIEAAMLAESEFNKYLEEEGEKWSIKLVTEDTQSDPEIALEKIMAFNEKGIKLVSGPETSASIISVKEYAGNNDMLLFSCCSVAPSLSVPGDNIFRLITDDTKQGAVFDLLFEHEEIEAVVPVWRGDVWGDGLSQSVKNDFAGGVMDAGIRYDVDAEEFSAQAEDLAGRVQKYVDEYGAEKVAVLYIGFGEMVKFIEAASAHEILGDVRWFGSDSNTNDEALVMEPTVEFTEKTKLTTVQVSASGGSAFYKVRDHVEEALGKKPNSFAHSTYDTIWLIGLAMLETRSIEAGPVAAALPVIAAEHEGAIGSTELNEAGDLADADYSIWGVRDGQWARLGNFDYIDRAITLDESGLGEVRIGMIIPETGSLEYFGEEAMLATQLGVADFNDHLEETGATWSMSLETRDTKSNAQDALAGLESLNEKGISLVLGASSSATITGIKDYADSNDMLILGCCSSAPSLAIPGGRRSESC
ncbi:MAG: branched-chain amino acid ABC transporter substrate-binding protein [Nitrosopumilus sp. H13]|nr:MAG: branched-chain amino acid ABC transporter substrate-binding protein [Nitrosopumilus sp. H13]